MNIVIMSPLYDGFIRGIMWSGWGTGRWSRAFIRTYHYEFLDSSVVDALYRSNARALERQLRRQYPTIADASADAVQHAFGKLAISDVPLREPMSWVGRICNNFMIDVLRRGRRQDSYGTPGELDRWMSPTVGHEADDRQEEEEQRASALRRALAQIDEPMHTALIMMYLQGCNYRQIAEATGLALASVGTILLRARKRMRVLLEAELRPPHVAMGSR